MDVGKWSEATRPLISMMLIATTCAIALIVILSIDLTKIDAMGLIKDFFGLALVAVLFWLKDRSDAKNTEQLMNTIKTVQDSGKQL